MIFSGHTLRGVIAGSCCLFLLVWSQLMNEGNSTSTAWSRGKKINLMNSGCEGKMCSESLFHGEGRRKKAVKLLPSSVWSKIRLDVGFPAGVKEALCYISPGWPCSGRQRHCLKATPQSCFEEPLPWCFETLLISTEHSHLQGFILSEPVPFLWANFSKS